MTATTQAAAAYWQELLHGTYATSTVEAVLASGSPYHLQRDDHGSVAVLQPSFVEASTVEVVERAASAVASALRIATARLLRDREFRLQIGFPSYTDELVELDDVLRHPIVGRIDGLFQADGSIRFVEFNPIPGGVVENYETSRVLACAPIARAFAQKFPFTITDSRDRLFDTVVAEVRGRGRPLPPGIDVEMRTTVADEFTERPWLGYLASRGCRLSFADAAALEVRDDAVYAGDERIDVIDVAIDGFLDPHGPLRPLLGAIRRGLVSTMHGLSSAAIGGNKLVLEALSDPAHVAMFDTATQLACRAHVPWTRHVRARRTTYADHEIDLLPFVAAHRERFVLKPAAGYGGDSVELGWKCDQAAWDRSLKIAARRPYVVQERVEVATATYPWFVYDKIVDRTSAADHNPFLWNGGAAAGFSSRNSVGIHNLKAGACQSAVFVLAPR